jgi:hypothetical protein
MTSKLLLHLANSSKSTNDYVILQIICLENKPSQNKSRLIDEYTYTFAMSILHNKQIRANKVSTCNHHTYNLKYKSRFGITS